MVDGSETRTAGNKHSFLSFEFYQQYFDVDTEQVQARVLNSAFPKIGSNFIRDHVQPMPDLYGPFWVVVTLVFCASICANFARYIETLGEASHISDFGLGMSFIRYRFSLASSNWNLNNYRLLRAFCSVCHLRDPVLSKRCNPVQLLGARLSLRIQLGYLHSGFGNCQASKHVYFDYFRFSGWFTTNGFDGL